MTTSIYNAKAVCGNKMVGTAPAASDRNKRHLMSRLRSAGFLGLALVGLATASALAQEALFMPAPSTTEQQLIMAYRQMYRFMVAADTSSLKPLLASDFTLVHITGYVQPRDEWLAHIDNGRMRYFSAEEVDVSIVKLEAQRATLRGRDRVKVNIWGAQGTWPLQLEIDFALVNGRWLMRQATASTY